MRNLIAPLLLVLTSSSVASANFSLASVEPGTSGGFQFNYDWSGVTSGTPPPSYEGPPSSDFAVQVMEVVTGIAPGTTFINYDPTHFFITLIPDYDGGFDLAVWPTLVAYTSGINELLFSILDNYNGATGLPGYYDVSGAPTALNDPVGGPSGSGNFSAIVPEPASVVMTLIGGELVALAACRKRWT